MDRFPQHLQPLRYDTDESHIVCIECLRPWLVASERWRLKITDDAEPVTVPYCPDCARREFG
jgi:hypothetical protein